MLGDSHEWAPVIIKPILSMRINSSSFCENQLLENCPRYHMVTPLIPEVIMKCTTRSNSREVESSKVPKVSYGLIFDTWGSHGMDH
jgi:hypothetical protein